MIPSKRDGEGDFAYHKRLVYGKLVDKTLADDDYAELSIPLYGKEYSSDNTRRMMYGSLQTIRVMEKAGFDTVAAPDCTLADLERRRLDIATERQKLQLVKRDLLRDNNKDARIDLFFEQLAEAMQKVDPAEYARVADDIPVAGDKEWLLGLADLHYGAKFESIHNSYSRDECRRRLDLLANEVLEAAYKNDITHLTVLNAGDCIQGILRLSDLQINEIPVVDAVVEVSWALASFLNRLSELGTITYIHVPSANHTQTRPLGSKASELAAEDLERIIIRYVRDLLSQNERVDVVDTVGREDVQFEIAGHKCIALHGHQIKDVTSCAENLTKLHRKLFDYVFLGHYHGGAETVVGEADGHNVEVIALPSFIGSDPFSDKLLKGSKSMAKLFAFDTAHGHIGTQNFILN